ncbi:hypothetical protein B0T20DRAFT_486595 [Sordaria brevicollis]|uniref:Uncharacterized protein n=1 Tax=Sordaria brevicollis TaxID=83679 RepID=A0AAE0UHD3_SORBR|nr:hypothetical protein B0T20DRAFT_486595 [Sordaria brevicollis]
MRHGQFFTSVKLKRAGGTYRGRWCSKFSQNWKERARHFTIGIMSDISHFRHKWKLRCGILGAAADSNPCGPALENRGGPGGVERFCATAGMRARNHSRLPHRQSISCSLRQGHCGRREGVRLRDSRPSMGNRRQRDWWKGKTKHMQAFDGRVQLQSWLKNENEKRTDTAAAVTGHSGRLRISDLHADENHLRTSESEPVPAIRSPFHVHM